MISALRNGQLAKRHSIILTYQKTCEKILEVLWNEGFILGYKNYYHQKNKNFMEKVTKIFLKYRNGKPMIKVIKQITKPGQRIYYSIKQIWKINAKSSVTIISTNKGFKTVDECKKLKLGGEAFITLK